MLHQIWSLIERLTPRLASAGIVFVLAALTDPKTVGLYNWAMLAYTAFQSVTDMPIRHILVRVTRRWDVEGKSFLRHYRIVAAVLGLSLMAMVVMILFLTASNSERPNVLTLLPIAFAPVCTAIGIRYVGVLQTSSMWSTLARGQLIAALLALAVTVPVLYLSRSALGASLQVLLAEGFFAAWCWYRARSVVLRGLESETTATKLTPVYLGMSAYSGLGWLQGQADRLLVGGLAGAKLLGAYSTAGALARSVGDAIASSTANVLRTQVAGLGADATAISRSANRALIRSLLLAGASFVVSLAAIELLARPVLGASWTPALDAAPIIALTAYGSSLSWSGSVLQALGGKHWRANIAPATGLIMAPIIAIAATYSLQTAAWLLVTRELVVVLTSFMILGRAAPWRAFGFMILATACSACLLFLVGIY